MKRLQFGVNIEGKEFWQREQNYFVKKEYHAENEYLKTIVLDQIKRGNPSFFDPITGRMVGIIPRNNGYELLPGIEQFSEEDIVYFSDIFRYAVEVDHNSPEKYAEISEDYLFHNMFCELLASDLPIDKLPCNRVFEFEREYISKTYQSITFDDLKDKETCKSLNRVLEPKKNK